jgi:hypothetical protein
MFLSCSNWSKLISIGLSVTNHDTHSPQGGSATTKEENQTSKPNNRINPLPQNPTVEDCCQKQKQTCPKFRNECNLLLDKAKPANKNNEETTYQHHIVIVTPLTNLKLQRGQ